MITRLDLQSMIFLIVAFSLFTAVAVVVLVILQRKNRLGNTIVKEAVDSIRLGICYFDKRGMVKLCNSQMEKLYRTIAQSDLRHIDELHSSLASCNQATAVVKVSDTPQCFQFPDGTVWQYEESVINFDGKKQITQAMLYDVSGLFENSIVLREQSRELRKMSVQLKGLSDNVLSLTREQEILDAKTKLHDQIGAGVTAVRYALVHSDKPDLMKKAYSLLKKSVSTIKRDNDYPVARNAWDELLEDAKSVGVSVVLDGKFPEPDHIRQLLYFSVNVCITNAVMYADASVVRVEVSESNKYCCLKITNNGNPPTAEIVPKGGLKNLEQRLQIQGAEMKIQSFPKFALIITIPKKVVLY